MTKPHDHHALPELADDFAGDEAFASLSKAMREQSDAQLANALHGELDAAHGFDKLLVRIEAEDDAANTPSKRDGAPWWMVRAQAGAIVALAASLAIVAVWLPSLDGSPSPKYEVFSDRSEVTGQADLNVVFNTDTSLGELAQLLNAVGGEIASGPSPVGVFGIVIDDQATVDAALEALRNDGRVLLAEPAERQR